MKRIVAALLVLTMVLALTGTAMAASKLEKQMVEFKRDATAYSAAKSSKATKNVVQKGSWAKCEKVCGKFAKVLVNENAKTYCWFKTCDLKLYEGEYNWIRVVWAKGGKGMSTCVKSSIEFDSRLKGVTLKVTGHTNLRKNPGMKFKSQGVVEKCDKLKMTGRVGYDDRYVIWIEVCQKGKKLWISSRFVKLPNDKLWETIDKLLYGE